MKLGFPEKVQLLLREAVIPENRRLVETLKAVPDSRSISVTSDVTPVEGMGNTPLEPFPAAPLLAPEDCSSGIFLRLARSFLRHTSTINPTSSQVLNTIGLLAIALGIALAITCIAFFVDGERREFAESAAAVAAFAVYFVLTGTGLCCHMRVAAISLAMGIGWLASAQGLAAFRSVPWPRAIQHAICAVLLSWVLFLLWRHRRELR